MLKNVLQTRYQPPILKSFFVDNTTMNFIVYKGVLFFKNKTIKINDMLKIYMNCPFQSLNMHLKKQLKMNKS